MTNRKLLLILMVVIAVSCSTKKEQKQHYGEYNLSTKIETLNKNLSKIYKTDTVYTHDSLYVIIKYEQSTGDGYLYWGIKNKGVFNDSLAVNKYRVDYIKYSTVFGYIHFNMNCGTACVNAIFLPINGKGPILDFYYPLLLDRDKSLLVYAGNDMSNIVKIYNFKLHRSYSIKNICHPEIANIFNIDTVYITKDTIFIHCKYPNNKIIKSPLKDFER